MTDERRTSLAGLRGGAIDRVGDREVAARLAHALDLVAVDEPGELTHGFHSYPARFHPLLARRLLEGLPRAGAGKDRPRVLDPFVGSGTTLIEASLAGAAGLGVDLSPLAVLLSRLKATPWPAPRRKALVEASERVADAVTEAVRASRRRAARHEVRSKPQRTRFDDPKFYAPHVFRELVSLRLAIGEVADEAVRGALLLVLSAIVIKVSRQRSDTDERLIERAVPRGAPTRHFAGKARELVERMAAFAGGVPAGTPAPEVCEGDARRLTHLGNASVDLVITSPPYVGTYDYARHHVRRLGWLGLDARPLLSGELGARRGGGDPAAALKRWRRDVEAYVGELGRVLKPGGWGYLLVGDSVIGEEVVLGYEELERASRGAFVVVARAAQGRPATFPLRGDELRREHLVALRRR